MSSSNQLFCAVLRVPLRAATQKATPFKIGRRTHDDATLGSNGRNLNGVLAKGRAIRSHAAAGGKADDSALSGQPRTRPLEAMRAVEASGKFVSI
jgi:hypothetical protein